MKNKQMKKRLFGSLLAGLVSLTAGAQLGSTLSPYTQFGLGALSDQSQSFGRGMSGLSYGVRDSKFVNVSNPASYSAVDSLTMIFDLGMTGQVTNFKEGGHKINRKTADFDYATALFRILPHVGASVGVIPYSNIGYSYLDTKLVDAAVSNSNSYTNGYEGKGGFSQAYFGLGWEFAKGVSVGANISYFWGEYTKDVLSTFSDSYANTLLKTYTTDVSTWKLDLGAQWTMKLNKQDRLTLGATASIGHKLGADADLQVISTSTETSVATSTTDSVPNGLAIPYSFGGGFTYVHNNSLTVGADYQLQKWGSLDYPMIDESTMRYKSTSGLLQDRHRVTVGADWIPIPLNVNRKSHFFQRLHYRVGASYATPYYKIGTQDGPSELTVSAGVGIPIVNHWNTRSSLNISAQWVRTSAKDLIQENCFRINIGLTFNERWFAKWKVD